LRRLPGDILEASLHLCVPNAPNTIVAAANPKIANVRPAKVSNRLKKAPKVANANPDDAAQKPIPRNQVQSLPYLLGVNSI
jgi:hypothetical protein